MIHSLTGLKLSIGHEPKPAFIKRDKTPQCISNFFIYVTIQMLSCFKPKEAGSSKASKTAKSSKPAPSIRSHHHHHRKTMAAVNHDTSPDHNVAKLPATTLPRHRVRLEEHQTVQVTAISSMERRSFRQTSSRNCYLDSAQGRWRISGLSMLRVWMSEMGMGRW